MSKDDIRKLLNDTYLFAGVSGASLEAMAALASEKSMEQDERLYDPGDDSADFYVLVSGAIRFVLGDKSSTMFSGTVLRSRMVFGWASLIPDHPKRLGSAEAVEPTELLTIDGDKAMEILRRDPESGLKVMERLCGMIARSFMDQQKT